MSDEPRIRSADSIRILVVEDDAPLRERIVRAVTEWGFEVASVWSGEDAAKMHEENPFDIAILDLQLPGINGIETLTQLRRKLPHIQGVILTGSATVDAARQAIHLGVVEFLTKPCNRGEMERAIDRARRRLPPLYPEAESKEQPSGPTLAEVEREHILAVLEQNKGDRGETARQLGVSRKTLYNKLRDYLKRGFAAR